MFSSHFTTSGRAGIFTRYDYMRDESEWEVRLC